jgi:uncharacterized membrane protein HdeD (DUF308 family)
MEALSHMKLSVNVVVQFLGLIAQGLNQVLDLASPKAKFWIMVGLSVIQGIVGILAHFSNTDGTPQAVAYLKQ